MKFRVSELVGRIVFYVTPDRGKRPAILTMVYSNGQADLEVDGHTYPSVPYSVAITALGPWKVGTWHRVEDGITASEEEMSEAFDKGRQLGEALAALSGAKDTSSIDLNKIMVIGERFAFLEGYQDLRRGMEYMQGFTSGIRSVRPSRLIESVKEEE